MGIELSEGAGKGTNVHDVISGLRTFPIVEKSPVATGGPDEVNDAGGEVNEYPRDVDEGPVGSEENSDGKEDREDGPDTRLLAGGPMTDGSELELWAPTLPRRVNKEHSVEKDDARNMVGGEAVSNSDESIGRDYICRRHRVPPEWIQSPVCCFPAPWRIFSSVRTRMHFPLEGCVET